jgi:hypothetical protein
MTTIVSHAKSPLAKGRGDGRTGLFQEIRDFWRQFIVAAFDPYRPEQHYMRGPGPACRAKQPSSATSH